MKIISAVFFILIFCTASAQLTYLGTFNNTGANPACINSEWKWQVITDSTLTYYNSDFSLYKAINITWPTKKNWEYGYIIGAYQNFVTTDGQISYVLEMSDSNGNIYAFINKEDGTQVFEADSIYDIYPASIIENGNITWGMEVSYINPEKSSYYSVAGTYCSSCSSSLCSSTSGLTGPVQGNGNIEIYPNPSTNETSLRYRLPAGITNAEIDIYTLEGQLLKKIPVNGPAGLLPPVYQSAGTYLYKLQTSKGVLIQKQVVVAQ